jgi:signal transduction histidine kinase
VPLTFCGRVLGFLAVGVLHQHVNDASQFESQLQDVADEVAKLLYHRQCVLVDRKKLDSISQGLVSISEQAPFVQTVHTMHKLERRLKRLEQVYNECTTASAVYDLFGRLSMINDRMRSLLHTENVPVQEMTTVDLVACLTRRGRSAARELLSRVVTRRRQELVPVRLQRQHGSYILSLRPLEFELPQSQIILDEPAPFKLQGVLCELFDRSSMVELYRMKDRLAETLVHSLRNDLAAIDLAGALMGDSGVPLERPQFEGMLHARVRQASATIRECQRVLLVEEEAEIDQCVPIDPVGLLRSAIETVRPNLEEHEVSVGVNHPELTGHVIAVLDRLRQSFETILNLLIRDARQGSEIQVHVIENLNEVVCTFTNAGFGVNAQKLREALDQEQARPTGEFAVLRDVSMWISEWGGNVVVISKMDQGTTFKLLLRRFQ